MNFSTRPFNVGDTLWERFVFCGPQVVLDTRPGLFFDDDFDIPDLFIPYLKLFPHRIHYSQLFAVIWVGESEKAPVLLLDQAPLTPEDFPEPATNGHGEFGIEGPMASAQSLTKAWSKASPLRQLNWLWQMSQLWDPFSSQGVAQSLTKPELLRVEGSLLRVLELHNDDPQSPPALSDLGQMLNQYRDDTASAFIASFARICDQLTDGTLTEAQSLAAQLEKVMVDVFTPQKLTVSLATRTDPGVTRSHNEDQCFPPSGSATQGDSGSLIIVCDGVGGHAGGEVASATAIEALQEHLSDLNLAALSTDEISEELRTACCHANDLICAQNDKENRQERARMGTTLVMALMHNQRLYVAHIGDSRAYLITKAGCYQLTVDDDIASREVRLGYLPYNEALKQPTAGSLIQALGMSSSSHLHPTIQRFIIDDESLLLLCSDGLSDYDRVEEIWQAELLPLLHRNYDLASVSQRLISLANHLNGHDNVTVGLMKLSFGAADSEQASMQRADLDLDFKSTIPTAPLPDIVPESSEPVAPSDEPPSPKRGRSFGVPLAIGVLIAVLAVGAWAFLNKRQISQQQPAQPDNSPLTPTVIDPEVKTDEISPESLPPTRNEVRGDQFFQISNPQGVEFQLSPPDSPADLDATSERKDLQSLPTGSVLKTVAQSESDIDAASAWWQVQICDRIPSELQGIIQANSPIWVRESTLRQQSGPLLGSELSGPQLDRCTLPLETGPATVPPSPDG
ncbi:MAG: protein phosphatase 2C domain-containing protein [Cyanobacteria bacterium P01_F01_bin.42]